MPSSVTATLAPMATSGTAKVALDDLLEQVAEYAPAAEREAVLSLIRRAHEIAERAHGDQTRLSGEPFIQHPLSVALLLADLHLDAEAIAAGLLHDSVEDTGLSLPSIRKSFGANVADLVDGLTKLEGVSVVSLDEHQAQNLRKVFLAMARDIRVVIIKLADRLHNVQTAWVYPPEKRSQYARETLEIYAPLAGRLGIEEWRWQLEDHAFKIEHPDRYRDIARWLLAERQARESAIETLTENLRQQLDAAGIEGRIHSRVKHIYSIELKMRRKSVDLADIYDILAVRVIVDSEQDCYAALGVVHGAWRHIPSEFDDYISAPKENGYRSIHTAVLGPDGKAIEVQIRTHEMHQNADYGVASHWRYKEGGPAGPEDFAEKLSWVRQILTWQEDESPAGSFVEAVKADFFSDAVFVFTPRGEIKDLPVGSTPLDFAYRIHTDVGHRCIGAKVNGRLVPLEYELQNGDVAEILTSKNSPGPSRNWLSLVRTAYARDKIRQWFKRHERADNIDSGRAMLDRELQRLGQGGIKSVADDDLKEIGGALGYQDIESLLAGVGYGATSVHQVITRLKLRPEIELEPWPSKPPARARTDVQPLVNVLGAGNLLTRVAACCKPLPGDAIVGFITRGHGITVHRRTCPNVLNVAEPERVVSVEWGARLVEAEPDLPVRLASCCAPRPGSEIAGVVVDGAVEVHRPRCRELAKLSGGRAAVHWIDHQAQTLPVTIRISADDREGLTHDVTGIIRDEGLNISSANISTNQRRQATLRVTVRLQSVAQLARLVQRLEAIRGVVSVARDGPRRR